MITIYCDGSIYPNPGGPEGWAFVATDEHGEITEDSGGCYAAPGNSNNRAELRAMLNSLVWLDGRAATIYSDSNYVVEGINKWALSWARVGWYRPASKGGPIPNIDLWKQLLELRQQHHVIKWVRGHAGISGNERADKLAEAARHLFTIQPETTA